MDDMLDLIVCRLFRPEGTGSCCVWRLGDWGLLDRRGGLLDRDGGLNVSNSFGIKFASFNKNVKQ